MSIITAILALGWVAGVSSRSNIATVSNVTARSLRNKRLRLPVVPMVEIRIACDPCFLCKGMPALTGTRKNRLIVAQAMKETFNEIHPNIPLAHVTYVMYDAPVSQVWLGYVKGHVLLGTWHRGINLGSYSGKTDLNTKDDIHGAYNGGRLTLDEKTFTAKMNNRTKLAVPICSITEAVRQVAANMTAFTGRNDMIDIIVNCADPLTGYHDLSKGYMPLTSKAKEVASKIFQATYNDVYRSFLPPISKVIMGDRIGTSSVMFHGVPRFAMTTRPDGDAVNYAQTAQNHMHKWGREFTATLRATKLPDFAHVYKCKFERTTTV